MADVRGGPAVSKKQIKLAVVVSHPIPYYVPIYQALAVTGEVEVKAFYCSRIGMDKIMDPSGMGVEIKWNLDLLGGYLSEFLPEAKNIKKTTPLSVNNPSIGRALKEYKPDVVLLHGYNYLTSLRTLLWCRLNGVPVMNISDRSLSGKSTLVRRLFRALALPAILRQFTAFLCIGDSIEHFFMRFGAKPEQVFRVPVVLHSSIIEKTRLRASLRQEIRSARGWGNEFVILFVGKLIERKRPQDLLYALERLASVNTAKKFRLVFCGDGVLRDEMTRYATLRGCNVDFMGFVNADELPNYYAAADVLAHPAENESYGMIAVEAANFGLPLILCEKVGAVGASSVAQPGRNALIHGVGDIETLTNHLISVGAEDGEQLAKMAAESLVIAKDHDGSISTENAMEAIHYCLTRS